MNDRFPPARPAEAWAGCPLRALLEALRRLGVALVRGPGCASPAARELVGSLGAGSGDPRAPRVALLSADELAHGGAAALRPSGSASGAAGVIVLEGARRGPSTALDALAALRRGLAARWREIDVFDLAASAVAIREELDRPGQAVIVARGRCPLQEERHRAPLVVVERRCNRCGACLRLGCPAISEFEEAMAIDASSCVGCGLCRQVCRAGAIVREGDGAPGGLPPRMVMPAQDEGSCGVRPLPCGRGSSSHGPVRSIVLAGVLGQPVLAAARLLARAATCAGLAASALELPVPGSPGSVAAHVRIGGTARAAGGLAAVVSPIVNAGGADLLLGFEPLEALRAAPLLSPRGLVALCDRLMPTFRMRARLEPRPTDLAARLGVTVSSRVAVVPASALGGQRGLEAAAVLLGCVADLLPFPSSELEWRMAAIPDLDASREAFARGRAIFERLLACMRRGTRSIEDCSEAEA